MTKSIETCVILRSVTGTNRAVILDFDGVLLDTESIVRPLWEQTCAGVGLHLPATVGRRGDGTTSSTDIARWLAGRLSPLDVQDLTAHFERENLRRADALPLMPDAREFLARCADSARTLAVASGNDPWWVERHLDRLGVRSWFSAVICAGGTLRPKPYPDVYVRALAVTGVEPAEAVAVEDSFAGLRAAVRARVPVVWASRVDAAPPPDLPVVRRVRTLADLLDATRCVPGRLVP